MNFAGPSLPMPLFGHSMVPLGLGQAIIGGVVYSNYAKGLNAKTFVVSCSQLSCDVKTLQPELHQPRAFFIAIPIPDSISGCISKSKLIIKFAMIDPMGNIIRGWSIFL